MVQTIEHTVCECCRYRIEYADESSCRHYYGHGTSQHPACNGTMWVDEEDVNVVWSAFTCDACDGDFLPGVETFRMTEFV